MAFEMIDVTSMSRPDPDWAFVDTHNHVHRWYVYDGYSIIPAESYSPMRRYLLPTLTYIQDDPGDEEYPATGHYECILCHEPIRPGKCADSTRQHIPGLRHL